MSSKKNNKFDLTWLGYLFVLGYIPSLELFRLFGFFLFIPFFRSIFTSIKNQKKQQDAYSKTQLLMYFLTSGLSFINPFIFVQISKQILGQIFCIVKNYKVLGKYLPETYQQKTSLQLPFSNSWTALNGGITRDESHSWEILSQRFAYDFVMIDQKGKTYKNKGKNLDDYYAFLQPIHAPAEGIVVEIKDGIRDYPHPRNGIIDWKITDIRGNYVVIQHNEQEFSLLAHLKKNSLKVKRGDKVKQGQIIGLCGDSGHSSEPHLHYQLQNKQSFYLSIGLPIKFDNVQVDKNFFEKTFVSQGQKISNRT